MNELQQFRPRHARRPHVRFDFELASLTLLATVVRRHKPHVNRPNAADNS